MIPPQPFPGHDPQEGPWNLQLRLLSSGLGGLILGAAAYAFGGVLWRCLVLGSVGAVAIWFVIGSLISAARTWPKDVDSQPHRRPVDLWRVPALGLALGDRNSFNLRLRPRLMLLAEQSLATRQIVFNSDHGRRVVGERAHEILTGSGQPPHRSEILTVIRRITTLTEDTGSGGSRAIDEALATKRRRRSGR